LLSFRLAAPASATANAHVHAPGATAGAGGPRVGYVTTAHGGFRTPVFMPVGTQATVKGLTPAVLADLGVEILLANAYHLYLRPGHERVAALGGLHRFMGWPRPILTDSGGFQVFSLGGLQQVSQQGVTFRSHLDGSLHEYAPEKAIAVQEALGSDIIMPLDECLPYPAEHGRVAASVELTSRWAARCQAAQTRGERQALFGIVQGGVWPDLRQRSARQLVELGLPGYAIGGLSVGEPKGQLIEALDAALGCLPADRPRYLMGVGTPDLLVEGVRRGVDMFDCVLPTRTARLGTALVPAGRLVLRNAPYAADERPIQVGCDCYACRTFSRAYIRHLLRAREMLGGQLITIHNLRYLMRLMDEMRRAIAAGRFDAFAAEFWRLRAPDAELDNGKGEED
jgi:queuine tRNA-ribosyltransferase